MVYLTGIGLLVFCSYFGFVKSIGLHGLFSAVLSVRNSVEILHLCVVFLQYRFQLISYFSTLFREVENHYRRRRFILYLISFVICIFYFPSQ